MGKGYALGNIKTTLKKFSSPRYSAAYVAKLAMLVGISFVLYSFAKFNIPAIFPSFLEMQISELPALLAGFSMGPVSGCLVIILKCLLKFPLTTTSYVGESTDILLGIAFVLPASIIYRLKKDKKHALIGLAVGSLIFTASSILVNRFISVPFYVEMFFGGKFDGIVGMLSVLYKDITKDSFYLYYLCAGVLPFNLLRSIIVSLITFLVYKRLSVLLHWEGKSLLKKSVFGITKLKSEKETFALAAKIADTLSGGEVLLLNGELGAGKTTFTKGLAKALGVKEEVSSPTFTILNVYESGRLKLNHLDMYRIENPDELAELGIEESIGEDGVTVIEWNKFEKFDGKVINIDIKVDGKYRIFDISLLNDVDEDKDDVKDDENDIAKEVADKANDAAEVSSVDGNSADNSAN